MTILLTFAFIFFIGSVLGWIIELIFRRIVHGKWINPGFLVGPYLPIYGFGLTSMTLIYFLAKSFENHFFNNSLIIIILMGSIMTLLELIGGLGFLYAGGLKLWDYSDRWGNYKGIICPLFSIIWTVIAGVYYYFIANPVVNMIIWFSNNLSFSFIVGFFFGIITIDFVYSTNLLIKLKKLSKENKFVIKYEELKLNIKKQAEKNKEKYSFIFPLKYSSLSDRIKEQIQERLDRVNIKR